jgi:translation initiation factor 2B subunit (eIF-2B alpha/beta/delta family)
MDIARAATKLKTINDEIDKLKETIQQEESEVVTLNDSSEILHILRRAKIQRSRLFNQESSRQHSSTGHLQLSVLQHCGVG